jgi:hypothetical protein
MSVTSGSSARLAIPAAPGDVPFPEADQGAMAAQVRSELRAGDAHQIFGDRVGIVGNHNPATFPRDPLQIGNGFLHVQAAAVRADRLADTAAPVVDARDSRRNKLRSARGPMIGQKPESESFELALGDDDRQC